MKGNTMDYEKARQDFKAQWLEAGKTVTWCGLRVADMDDQDFLLATIGYLIHSGKSQREAHARDMRFISSLHGRS